MDSNWGKAIQATTATLGAIVLGVMLSFFFDSVWPLGIAGFCCCAAYSNAEIKNYLLARRIRKLEQELES